MSHDAISSWVDKAKLPVPPVVSQNAVKVIRREVQNRGNLIMEVAEKIRPALLKLFEGVHGKDGMLLQPAHIRGMALNMAQNIVKEQEQ